MHDDMVSSIHCAATVHDIGEISIPEMSVPDGSVQDADALSGGLIMHPTVGAAMVEEARLGGSVAQMIRQHHERIDGSGYPYGLTGAAMLVGSQVLGLADVVAALSEQMSATQECGLEAVLSRIDAMRDKCFNAEIVGACMRLFREESFHLKVVGAHN